MSKPSSAQIRFRSLLSKVQNENTRSDPKILIQSDVNAPHSTPKKLLQNCRNTLRNLDHRNHRRPIRLPSHPLIPYPSHGQQGFFQGKMPVDFIGINVYENNRASCVPVCSGICFVHVRFAGRWSWRLPSVAAVWSGEFLWRKSFSASGRFWSGLSAILRDT